MNGTDERSLKDVTFLRAVRDINGSPERYASTEQGATPATVTAITHATMLTEEEVEYRLDHLRLEKGGLVQVYEAGPPDDDSVTLDSAELTEAGEQVIAEAEYGGTVPDDQGEQSTETTSAFDDIQEWESADAETASDAAAVEDVSASGTTAANEPRTGTESPTPSGTDPTKRSEANTEPTNGTDETDTRLEALESRIEQLEAENADSESNSAGSSEPNSAADREADSVAAERVDELVDEVAALQETTDRLESTLDDALDELDAIRESEYGALAEKRTKQFETAVKSMVAFHQLATEVLDVRVENYEPSAGRADPERVEITRNRIGDALGVGKSGGGGDAMNLGGAIDSGDSDWPDPEEVAGGGGAFSTDDDERVNDESARDEPGPDDPELKSDAPETGVYPPVGGSRSADRDAATEAEVTGEEVEVTGEEAGDEVEVTGEEVEVTGEEAGDEVEVTGEEAGDEVEVTGEEAGDEVEVTGENVTGDEVEVTGENVTGDEVEVTGENVTGDEVEVTGEEAGNEVDDDESASDSDAPETGVYPPVGDRGTSSSDDASPAEGDDTDSDEDEPRESVSSVYPPISGNRDDESAPGALPESLRPDTDVEGEITETAADEGHVVDPIRSTDADATVERLPLDIDPEESFALHRAVSSGAEEQSPDPWHLTSVDPAVALDVRQAVVACRAEAGAENSPTYDDPYPHGETYARIVGEDSLEDSTKMRGLPTEPSPVDSAKVRMADGQGTDSDPSEDEGSARHRSGGQDEGAARHRSGGQDEGAARHRSSGQDEASARQQTDGQDNESGREGSDEPEEDSSQHRSSGQIEDPIWYPSGEQDE